MSDRLTVGVYAENFSLSQERVNSVCAGQAQAIVTQIAWLEEVAISGAMIGPRSFNPEALIVVTMRLN